MSNFQCKNVGKIINIIKGNADILNIYLDTIKADYVKEALVSSSSPQYHIIYNEIKTDLARGEWWKGIYKTKHIQLVNKTIRVKAGTCYDGKGKLLSTENLHLVYGTSGMDGPKPYFILEQGASLKNVTIKKPGADGIWCYGDNVIENVHWQDCDTQSALSLLSSAKCDYLTIKNCSINNSSYNAIQINASCTLRVSNLEGNNILCLIRQNGGKKFKMTVYLDSIAVKNLRDVIIKSDSPACRVYYRNIKSDKLESPWWKLKTEPEKF